MNLINRKIEKNILEDETRYFLFDPLSPEIRLQTNPCFCPHIYQLYRIYGTDKIQDIYEKFNNILWPLDDTLISLNFESS